MTFSKKKSVKNLITRTCSSRQLKRPDYQKAVSALLTLFLLFQISGASAAPPPDWYNTSWNYRRAITIDNTGNASELTNYDVQIILNSSNFDFTKAQTNGEDLKFTDSDGTTMLLWHRIESYDSTGQAATIWARVPTVPASSTKTIYMYYGNSAASFVYDYIRLSVSSTTHNDYGLAYPVTYEFSIPAGSSNLKAYKRYTTTQSWTQITEKTSSDFFNGIEAVRFDYSNNRAYISVAFSDASDEIHLKVTDSSDQSVDISYQGIPDYYDNRDAVVVATADDWDGYGPNNTGFKKACDAFTSRKIWLTPGITTQGVRKYNWPPVSWSEVQPKIDAGYIEVASHSREHLGETYSYRYTGHHTGADNEQYTLTNCEVNFPTDSPPYTRNLVGWIIENTTDGSSGTITSSTAKTITCSAGLSGGTDNDWDTGDTYLIDRHDEEIGDSKTEIINNLDLPALNKKGSQEYVYAWIEPFGLTNPTITTKLGQYKYLADRSTDYADTFAWWDSLNGVFNRIGTSLLVDYSNLTAANNQFDAVISAGNIYHMYMHPKDVNWATGSWVQQHLDYIKEKPNLWYVGFGHLYLYHYIDDQNKVTVAKMGVNDNALSPVYSTLYDDFSRRFLNGTGTTPRFWSGIAMSSDGQYQTAVVNGGYIYVSVDYGDTWIFKGSCQHWKGVAMSSTGQYQTAVVNGGQIYISTNYGETWTLNEDSLTASWTGVAMSSDGVHQTAVVNGGQIYISTNYGETWTLNEDSPTASWTGVAMSSDGVHQTVVASGDDGDYIYVSIDSGESWNSKDDVRKWSGVAMSSDGVHQTAVAWGDDGDYIYVSDDSGASWSPKDDVRCWSGVAMSSDGVHQTAVVWGGYIYVSPNSGANWTEYTGVGTKAWFSVAMSSTGQYQTAVVYGGQIYTSSNYGDNWDVVSSTLNTNYWAEETPSQAQLEILLSAAATVP